MKRRAFGYLAISLAILATLGFIFGNSLQNAAASNSASGEVLEQVEPIVDPLLQGVTGSKPDDAHMHAFVRKAAHFLEFALLGAEFALLAVYHKRRIWSELLYMPLFATLFCAMTDELIQNTLDRTSSVTDVCLDFCGGVAGIAMVIAAGMVVAGMRKQREKPQTHERNSV